jgi:hypothetical protein
MRTLQVLGLAEAGDTLVCKDPATGELFGVAADERLRAAARGDVSRLGQLEIEMESQLRPREIQARIRAGATVEEVAAAAGTDPVRIERFAYPVLLERSSTAEKAQRGHLMSNGVPGRRRLADIVGAVLAERGQNDELSWDAFKDDKGWLLCASWRAGRSENRAHWRYHPGPDGGTLTAHDDAATELIDPAPKPLRTVRAAAPVTDDPPTQEIPKIPSEPTPARSAAEMPVEVVDDTTTVVDERSAVIPASAAHREARTGTESARGADEPGRKPTARAAKRGNRPVMPSWEDVLLGGSGSGGAAH